MKTQTASRLVIALAVAAWVAPPCLARPAPDTPAAGTAVAAWKAVAASGTVQARPAAVEAAVWRSVARGDQLAPRTLVETGRKGRVTLTRNASLLVVDPDSRIELPQSGYSEMETSVMQTTGSVLYKVDGRANPHFEVVTPYLVAGVKGTSFLVTVNDRYASVTVKEGQVEILDPGTGQSLTIGAGESVLRHREDHGLDLVHDLRHSKQARREAKRLDRMERRRLEQHQAEVNRLADRESDRNADRPKLDVNDEGSATWKHADATASLSDSIDETVKTGQDQVTQELIEEMIREGINDGVIADPIGDVIALPQPEPDEPTGQTGGNGGKIEEK